MSGRAADSERLGQADIAETIRGRRSINLFEPGPVDKETVLEAVELARWAPNHRLTEPWRFYLLGEQTAEAVARLAAELEAQLKGERAGMARLQRLRGIPGHFVLTCRIGTDELQQQEDYAACCCAVQNLMLFLWQKNVGVKWTTGAIVRERRFYELLGIDPARELVVGLFWYGRPKVVPTQKRRAVEDIAQELP